MLRRPFIRRRPLYNFYLNKPVEIKNPFNKLLKQIVATAAVLLIVTSVAPESMLDTGFTAGYFGDDTDFTEEAAELPPFIMNDEGFVLKADEPFGLREEPIYTDSIMHTVRPGENCSSIAALYGIKVNTLLWENSIPESCLIKTGQTLVVLPHDGVNHIVKKGETVASIAKSYGVTEAVIIEYNGEEELEVGQKVFIKDGKRKEPVYERAGVRSDDRRWTGNTFDTSVSGGVSTAPKAGKVFIWPVAYGKGGLTRGYRSGHLALDIADVSKPDIVAIAGGRIIKAQGGCPPREVKMWRGCNGGYGNYVIQEVDLPLAGLDGSVKSVQVLYAHMETIYAVEGQKIERGTYIGKMGSSGLVYGVTGIHLHIELHMDGVKRNLMNYL